MGVLRVVEEVTLPPVEVGPGSGLTQAAAPCPACPHLESRQVSEGRRRVSGRSGLGQGARSRPRRVAAGAGRGFQEEERIETHHVLGRERHVLSPGGT